MSCWRSSNVDHHACCYKHSRLLQLPSSVASLELWECGCRHHSHALSRIDVVCLCDANSLCARRSAFIAMAAAADADTFKDTFGAIGVLILCMCALCGRGSALICWGGCRRDPSLLQGANVRCHMVWSDARSSLLSQACVWYALAVTPRRQNLAPLVFLSKPVRCSWMLTDHMYHHPVTSLCVVRSCSQRPPHLLWQGKGGCLVP